MKRLFILMAGLVMISFMACGPSQKDKEKQKKTDDSLFQKERNNALDNANKLLSDTTSNTKDTVSKTKATGK
ncbi:MAG: hypothetical protein ABR968_03435 [Bacteroidales bacterium]